MLVFSISQQQNSHSYISQVIFKNLTKADIQKKSKVLIKQMLELVLARKFPDSTDFTAFNETELSLSGQCFVDFTKDVQLTNVRLIDLDNDMAKAYQIISDDILEIDFKVSALN